RRLPRRPCRDTPHLEEEEDRASSGADGQPPALPPASRPAVVHRVRWGGRLMRAYVEDRWWKVVYEDGKRKRVKTERYGNGARYRARWTDPSGKWRSASYEKKGDANDKIDEVKQDLKAGSYIDPDAGKTDVGTFATQWLIGLGGDPSTKERVKQSINKHVIPYFTGRAVETVAPSTIRT